MFKDLLKTWSPIVYLHSKEKYFPCSSDWLLKNSTLVDYTTNPITKISPVNNKDLYDNAKLHEFKKNEDNTLILSFNKDLYPGEIPISNVPCYGYVSRFEDKTFLRYVFLYANNGSYSIIGLREIGQHPGDIESIVVELDKNLLLSRVFFGAHGQKDGRLVNKKNIELENGKVVAYSALNGHGLYYKEGVALRMGGIANDYIDKGIKWVPNVVQFFQPTEKGFNPNTMGWTVFWGRIGGTINKGDDSGIMGIPDKNFFNNPNNINEKYLNPPIIFSNSIFEKMLLIKGLVLLIVIYIIFYFTLNIVRKIFPNGEKENKNFTIKQHAISIIIVYVLYILFKYSVGIIIDKIKIQ